MTVEHVIALIEYIGIIAFAISGVMVAIECRMDAFGVLVQGSVTAMGGGLIRDVILGLNPPMLFRNPSYIAVACGMSLVMFIFAWRGGRMYTRVYRERSMRVLDLLDALGLGTFTAVGAQTAITAGYIGNPFLLIFVGVLTGVGGGILRDVFAMRVPAVFTKRVYAVAAIVGGIVYVTLYPTLHSLGATIACTATVLAIRLLASRYRWDLPVVRHEP